MSAPLRLVPKAPEQPALNLPEWLVTAAKRLTTSHNAFTTYANLGGGDEGVFGELEDAYLADQRHWRTMLSANGVDPDALTRAST